MPRHLLALALLPLLISGGCAATPSNASVFDDLWTALETKDRSALPEVELVLEDSLKHQDRFDHETRKTAFEVLRATNMKELLPLVRQIAAMDYRLLGEPNKADLYDLVAIEEALITLREWRDPSAIEFNLRRLTSIPWLQTTAVNNLRLLEYWQATSAIQRLLDELPKDPEHLLTIRESVEYLRSSPNTSLSACDSITNLQRSFPSCFRDDNERWRCGTLSEDSRSLESRLGCASGLE